MARPLFRDKLHIGYIACIVAASNAGGAGSVVGPLTALALEQGGYDWGILAFSVGFSGSMIWFGSSAGVGLSNLFSESRSVLAWMQGGWHVIAASVLGFNAFMLVAGWNPTPERSPHGCSEAVQKTGSVS